MIRRPSGSGQLAEEPGAELIAPQQWDGAHSIQEQAVFRRNILKERSRSDRLRMPMSLALFLKGAPLARTTLEELSKRLRCTDEIGWYEHGQLLGVLLPHTNHAEAQQVSADLAVILDADNPSVFKVLTYPDSVAEVSRRSDTDDTSRDSTSRDSRDSGRPGVNGKPHGAGSNGSNGVTRPRGGVKPRRGEAPVTLNSVSEHFVLGMPWWKRAFDIVGSSALLLMLSPIFLATALAVKLTSKGPVFFAQTRAGLGGKPFRMFKFRSMITGADAMKAKLQAQNEASGPVFKMERDPRITTVGRWIRKLSIDELPQLANVLLGDMSLVGPRPPTFDEVGKYDLWQRRRLEVTPGLTCIWQVSGRCNVDFENWVRMDIQYSKKRSFLYDLKLLVSTVPAVLFMRGAH